MPTLTKDRGCLYYTPWIAIACVFFIGGAVGIWGYYTDFCKSHTLNALFYLDVTLDNLGRLEPALIATCCVYGGMAVVIFFLSLWRSSVEAGHDSTGLTTGSATAFLVCNSLANSLWYLLVLWTVIVICGDALWMFLVYMTRYAIQTSLDALGALSAASAALPSWVASSGDACPPQCLNLSFFGFYQSSLENACVCDPALLTSALNEFDTVYQYLPAVLAGAAGLLVFSILLFLNFGAQFSHTRRERELISRLTSKQFQYA